MKQDTVLIPFETSTEAAKAKYALEGRGIRCSIEKTSGARGCSYGIRVNASLKERALRELKPD